MPTTAAVWFRRDLRVHDHPALHAAVAAYDRVVPVFVLDDALLRGRYRSGARTRFMLGCLEVLDAQLRERGSGLTVLHGRPEDELAQLEADVVLWTSDVSPYARARDGRVTEALRARGVEARPHTGTYVLDVSVPKPQRVFARFFREWTTLERRPVLGAPERIPGDAPPTGVPDADALKIDPGVPEPVREPGELAARQALDTWLDGPIDRYGERQEGMARVNTSLMAAYLRWGCVSARECEQRAVDRDTGGARSWRRQLGWRDFYGHTLLRHPENVRTEQQERFRRLEKDRDPERLAAWAEGRTGYPLVDAGMRELLHTGFMHNRVRLVAGSFLTKELHLDWRLGEDVFARYLLCGEPAQNNGNWQWIAGTGTDPAPYFRRMYNPALHQQRFDPSGAYVRRWIPELAGVPDAKLAEPWTMTAGEQEAAGCVIGRDYPAPIVDRRVERERAKERYRAVSSE
jgi:deoxyribodipyrimidine photo-lyase